jgi:signal transduction histidine kinase
MSAAPPKGRLFRKYVVVLVALVGGVLVSSGLVELYLAYQETNRAVISVQREKAVAAAERIEQFIREIERHLRGTTHAAIDMRIDIATNVIAQQRELDFLRLLRNMPVIMGLRHLDVTGREQLRVSRFALDVVGSGEDFSQAPAFLRAKSRTTYFSPVYFEDDSEPYMTIAVPSGEATIEVTTAEVSLKAVWDVVSQIRVGRLGYAYVVDSRGHLIAHPDVSLVLQMRNLSQLPHVKATRDARSSGLEDETFAMVSAGLDGARSLITHAAIPSLGWFVFVEQPLDEVYAPVRLALVWGAMIVVLGLALSVLASVVLARRMVAPIRLLQAGAARVGRGELDHRIDIRTGDELEALAAEFNDTTARLQDSQRNLEQKVKARTEELTRSVEEMRALGEVGRAVSSTLDLQTVLVTIVTHAVELSKADAGGTIYEFDEATGVFEPRANYGVSEAYVSVLREARIRLGETAAGICAERRGPYQISDLEKSEDNRLRDLLLQEGIRAVLAVPLLREERVIGALVIRRKVAGELSQSVVSLLQTFASQSVLAIENARLFQQIQSASEELRAASQHKSQFLANMSHELRTPLNAVIGFSDVLLEKMLGEMNPKQESYIKNILASGKHLLSLINDILDLSKIEAGRMELEVSTVHVPSALQNAIMLIRERAQRHNIALSCNIDPQIADIAADERKFKQIMLNLLSNAVKFTPERGRVDVDARLLNDYLEISVKDTGVGIAEKDRAAVFEEFRQVGRHYSAKQEGTGLGLALTRRFVELHGGTIRLESEPGKGSTFTFTLPVHR